MADVGKRRRRVQGEVGCAEQSACCATGGAVAERAGGVFDQEHLLRDLPAEAGDGYGLEHIYFILFILICGLLQTLVE